MGFTVYAPRQDGNARFSTLQVQLTESSSITRVVVADGNGKFFYSSGGGGGIGTVTTVSVANANGLSGSVANATTTPVITLSTTVTGILKGNGTAISAATPGVDYITPTQGTASWAQNVVSSSYSLTSSYAPNYLLNSSTASFATTGSNTFVGNQIISGAVVLPQLTSQVNKYVVSYDTASGQLYYQITSSGGGGTATPGGASTQIQFNNAGAFDGVPSLIYVGGQLKATGSFSGSFIGNLTGTSSWSQNSLTSSFVTASNVYGPYGANSVISASYAANGGVTQLLAGANINLSPTNGLGQVTVSSTAGGSSFNTATGSYGSFYDTTTQTIAAINTPYSMSFNTTDITNGVSISGSQKTQIKFTNPGIYDLQFSAQLARAGGSGTEDVYIWIRKNGTNVANSNTDVSFVGSTNVRQVAAWNWFLNVAAGDYYEIIWSSTSTNIVLEADNATTPAVPSVIATVTRVDQFLSNSGSFSGSFNGIVTGSLFGTSSWSQNSITASYALTASYLDPNFLLPKVFQIVTGSISASVNIKPTNLFLINSGSTEYLNISSSGNTDLYSNLFMVRNFITKQPVLIVSQSIVQIATQSSAPTGTTNAGSFWFTNSSFYVGLD